MVFKVSFTDGDTDGCPNGNRWVYRWFDDCIVTERDMISFSLGLLSIFLYLFSLLPQFIKNYRRKTVEGLSLSFLLIWMLGDASNLAGAILTHQIATVQFTGIYFVVTGILITLQFLYYQRLYPKIAGGAFAEKLDEEIGVDSDEDSSGTGTFGDGASDKLLDNYQGNENFLKNPKNIRGLPRSSPKTMLLPTVILALVLSNVSGQLNGEVEIFAEAGYVVILGSFFAWMSGLLYFFSRLPQILTNFRLKDVEGLSLMLFIITISANVCYGLAILLRLPKIDAKFFESTLPYIIGSIGTLIFDFIIIYQALVYGNQDPNHPLTKIRKFFGLRPVGGRIRID